LYTIEHNKYTNVLCWHPTRNILLCVGDGGVYVRNGHDGEVLRRVPVFHVRSIEWMNDHVFVCGDKDGTVYAYAFDGQLVATYKFPSKSRAIFSLKAWTSNSVLVVTSKHKAHLICIIELVGKALKLVW
jgi:WD40 repeat protein